MRERINTIKKYDFFIELKPLWQKKKLLKMIILPFAMCFQTPSAAVAAGCVIMRLQVGKCTKRYLPEYIKQHSFWFPVSLSHNWS